MAADLREAPARLVEDYRPGSFFFASPQRTLLTSGEVDSVAEADPDELATRVGKVLAETGGIAVGALPYDATTPAHLVVPSSVRWAGPARDVGRPTPAPTHRVVSSDPNGYLAAVAAAVERLRDGDLRKVVLARTLGLEFDGPVSVGGLLPGLVAANPHGYTFAVGLRPGVTLLGASPELLLSRVGRLVTCFPLAGTLARDADPVVDRANAEALLASVKDQSEHRVVTESVVETLRPFCRDLTVPTGPVLVATPTVWHLATKITGSLHDPDVSSLRLASALHPTPAVCGMPVDAARSVIAELETFDRGCYSGAVGWCDAAGDGQWAVAIRCAEVAERSMRLYAGCGIMPASVPELELAETEAKLRTMLLAMGLNI